MLVDSIRAGNEALVPWTEQQGNSNVVVIDLPSLIHLLRTERNLQWSEVGEAQRQL